MADKFKACSIDGCKGNAHWTKMGKRNMCQAHWRRWKLYGDPLAGRTPDGEASEYYRTVVMNYEGAECLIWPYAGTNSGSGYGRLLKDGRLAVVSRLLCEETYGPPPTPEHEAAHSCGKGHEGCVTKGHLSWKSPTENSADRVVHGTDNRGENHPLSKLTENAVREIIALKGKEAQKVTAKRYGVNPHLISSVQTRRAWAWVKV